MAAWIARRWRGLSVPVNALLELLAERLAEVELRLGVIAVVTYATPSTFLMPATGQAKRPLTRIGRRPSG